jgi:hypothetical protein
MIILALVELASARFLKSRSARPLRACSGRGAAVGRLRTSDSNWRAGGARRERREFRDEPGGLEFGEFAETKRRGIFLAASPWKVEKRGRTLAPFPPTDMRIDEVVIASDSEAIQSKPQMRSRSLDCVALLIRNKRLSY